MIFASPRFRWFALVFARLVIAVAFLSSVADRFGAWGPHATPGVVWGDFQHFAAYTLSLAVLAPKSAAFPLAWSITTLESGLGLALLIGLRTRITALLSGCFLLVCALAMTSLPGGWHSVWASSALLGAVACLLLSCVANG